MCIFSKVFISFSSLKNKMDLFLIPCMLSNMYVCTSHVCHMPMEARRGPQIPGNWSGWLSTTTWGLGTKPGPFARVAMVLTAEPYPTQSAFLFLFFSFLSIFNWVVCFLVAECWGFFADVSAFLAFIRCVFCRLSSTLPWFPLSQQWLPRAGIF